MKVKEKETYEHNWTNGYNVSYFRALFIPMNANIYKRMVTAKIFNSVERLWAKKERKYYFSLSNELLIKNLFLEYLN